MKIKKTERSALRELAIQKIIEFFVTVIIEMREECMLAEHLLCEWRGLSNMSNKELEDLISDYCIEEFFEDNNIKY